MRVLWLPLAVLLGACSGLAQGSASQVTWSLALDQASAPPGSQVLARLTAKIEPGWHLYSLSTPKGGPIPTTIQVQPNQALAGFRIFQPKPKRMFDKNFNLDTETYEGPQVFLLELTVNKDAAAGASDLSAGVRYQVCNDRQCIPPVRRTATASFTVDPKASAAPINIPADYVEFKPGSAAPTTERATTTSSQSEGLGMFLLVAFGFGILAIFTPCVFPMIPITMSFFLKKETTSRRESIFQAAVFCLGIIVLFTSLGFLATVLLGPFGVVQLGSNPWVNGFIALVFLIFGLSLLGAFEITIPSSILTRLNQTSEKGGVLGTLLMGLTFSLSSFACVGPFMGTLLAASVEGGKTRPLIGMLSFAAGLSSPFFLLALFPSYLRRLPKSGGWLARVKVVMGFVVLAALFKPLSSIDQVMQWSYLTRERFLAAWIVLFAMAGLYLLGFLRLEGIGKDEHLGLGRLLAGTALLGFAISLLPGMFGARLGDLDAYVPPSALSGSESSGGLAWMKNDLRQALDQSRRDNKLVLVNFTGYACTNCHWMKANMFTRPEIAAALKEFVLLELYTDGTDESSRRNQELEESKFATIAIPYYAIIDADEKVVASFPSATRNPREFLDFLKKGLGNQRTSVHSIPADLHTLTANLS